MVPFRQRLITRSDDGYIVGREVIGPNVRHQVAVFSERSRGQKLPALHARFNDYHTKDGSWYAINSNIGCRDVKASPPHVTVATRGPTMSHAEFDVFLSYNRADQPDVLKLATRLKERGVKVWLDVWNLVAGEPWLPAVEWALKNCSACAVVVGPHGLGGVHSHEMWTAIERSLTSPEGPQLFRVIPVLLPNSTRGNRAQLPSFLTRYT